MVKVKNINTRIQLKNDTETNWNKAKAEEGKDGFIPLLGEAIVYMGESGHGPRIKIGDGETNVVDLPFLEDNDTVYTASDGIKITAENVIQHINHLDAFPSEIGFYKIKYDEQGHINGTTAVSKQDILDLLQMTPGRINSVQITATAPLISSNSNINTTDLTTEISFSSQEKNKVFAGPTQSASGSPSFRLLIADDIPNLPASKITEGTFSASRIDNLPASKITSGTFNEDRIPNLGPGKISGVIPVSKGGTGVNGVSGDPENNVTSFFDNGVFAYDSGNARFKQLGITSLGNTDTFTSYVNSLNGITADLLVDLDTLISAIPPMNLNNPREITERYTNSYYAPKTKGYENSVLISQGKENNNEGTEPIWLDPTALSTEEHPGGALFYGRDNSSENSPKPFKTQWGTLPVEQGGTGTTTFIADYVLIGSGKNAIRTIAKTYSSTPNTIVERNSNGDFATRAITLSKGLLCNGINNNFLDNLIIDIDNSAKIATFYGNINANNLNAVIGELNMSKTNSETLDQPSIKWHKGSSTKSESAIISQTSTLIGELYWDNNKANRGMLRNYYSSTNGEIHSDSYYLPAVNTSSGNDSEFTFLATADSISGMFPTNSILYSNGNVNKITYKNSANGALYSTGDNQNLEWGTLPVAQGGTGLSTIAANSVLVGNSIETDKTKKIETITTKNGAFYATGNNLTPQFGILPVAQGGTGVASIENIQAGKDGSGNNIVSTYQTKVLSGIRDFDIDNPTQNIVQIWNDVSGTNPSSVLGGNQWLVLTDIVNNDSYSGQLAIGFQEGIAWRGKAGTTTWSDWKKIPFVDGTGATGTWEINITGHASQDLPLAGGTMTGKITFNKVNNAIAYAGTKASYDMIKFIDNTGDEYGNGISIGGGGATIIGGGESADVAAGQVSGGNEVLYLCNDGDVNIFSNMQDGWASRKTFTFGNNGTVSFPNYIFNTTDIPEGAANLSTTAATHEMTFYRNGITIPYQMDNTNDGGILRVRGTSESNCILELGTWDDSGSGETIQFNYYPTTSQVTPTYSVSVPKASGTICLTNGTGASGTWGINVSGSAQTVIGAYTANGGRQNPNYFGMNKVGFLMMNTTVNGNSHYKDWLIMDCYSGSDVGGGVAIGVNRQALGAYIMRSAAARSSWAESAELLGTHNYTSYCPTKTGSGASGTWGINITGSSASCTGHAASDLALSGGTMTGNLSFSNSGTGFRGINYGTMGDNDQWRIGGAATASNAGYMEIATADDGNEPIYVRQYTGAFSSITRTLTLLDASGNTLVPGTITSYKGTGDTGSNTNGCVLQVGTNNWGNTGIFNGNGDGGGSGTANLIIKSWFGVGFVDGCTGNGMRASVNCRNGEINCYRVTANLGGSERRVEVDQGTSGTLYLFSNGSAKGIYSSTGYATGYIIKINGSGITHYGTVSSSSSKEVKTNIQYLNNTDYIDKLKPVSFIYKKDEKKKTHFGLIYEDTIDILPNICTIPEEEDEPKGINYIELVPVLLKEIQNLRKRIKLLENNT